MLEIGQTLQDRFLIEEQIGAGGMGAVYLATDQKFGSRVAIKQTIYDNRELAQAFEREARILNSLHHPVLPHVSDIFSEDGGLLLVMEYIEGEDLSEMLKRGETLPTESIIRWTFELLDALDYLHSQDPPIIHRDIKPNNLKVTPRGNIVLLDFGLAKETSGNTVGMRSVFGYSRRYSPLEQIEGTGTDIRSDIFSLGATIFHLLTGEPPIDAIARASAIVAGRPDPLKLASEINPLVPADFAALIKCAMALNPDDRFATAAALRTAMEQELGSELVPIGMRDQVSSASAEAMGNVTGPLTADNDVTPPVAADFGISHKAVSRNWVSPAPAMARSAAAAAISAAAAGRVKFREYRNSSWRKPALVGAAVLILIGLALGIFRSVSSGSSDTVAEASPSLASNAAAAGDVAVNEPSPQANNGGPTNSASTKSERKPQIQTVDTAKKPEPETVEVVNEPEPERPRVVKAPVRQRQPSDTGDPPVGAIEQIFTGQAPRGGDWERVSPEEEKRIRREMKRMKRKGQQVPY